MDPLQSHLFVLQLVHRPTIRHVLQSLLNRNLVPVDLCVAKIKRNFNSSHTLSNENKESIVDQASLKVCILILSILLKFNFVTIVGSIGL